MGGDASLQKRGKAAPLRSLALVASFLLSPLVLTGCAERPPKVPGETDITISAVTIKSGEDTPLVVAHGALFDRLGMRKKSLVLPGRYYSEFREAEDRRRIEAFWQTYGFFDVVVDPAKTTFDKTRKSAAIAWTVHEHERYKIAAVNLMHAPNGYVDVLKGMIRIAKDPKDIDLERYRNMRVTMAEHLRDEGFGHAMVYSRAFVDRDEKAIHWFYYVDAGPKTVIGNINVQGNHKIPAETIIDRVGLKPGDPYGYADKLQREFDLLDTGAFASSFIRTTADTVFIVPGSAPDTGGVLRPEQVDAKGNLIPRELSDRLDLTLHVVEAPSQQARVRAAFEIDPSRADTTLSGRLWLRNLFGPLHHLTLEGRVGYGLLWQDAHDDPAGFYGSATIRSTHPSAIGRLGDLRLTARFRNELYPGYHLNEVTVGPGIRATLAEGLFFDTDVFFRYGLQSGFENFNAYDRGRHVLANDDEAYGAELQASIIWDTRNNPVEPTAGHFLSFRSSLSPGGPLSTHRYLSLAPEARGFIPVSDALTVGGRVAAGWVALFDRDDGVPLGPRLFGGGSYGFRGLGRQRLSPVGQLCKPSDEDGPGGCQAVPVGGLSSLESSLEARWLPYLKPYGAVVFADFGGVGRTANPFHRGVNLAMGLGIRLRFWYLPGAIDFSYRLLQDSEVQGIADGPFSVFLRLGEAF